VIPILQPIRSIGECRKFEIPLKEPSSKVTRLRMVTDQTENWYYSEIEAAEMVGRPSAHTDLSTKPTEKETVYDHVCHIDRIPEEVVVNILEMLRQRELLSFCRVSRRCRSLCQKSILLLDLDLR
jgi:hypothetical protein